jgi:spermidine synthase
VALVAPLVFVVPLEYALAVGAGYALAPRLGGQPNRVVDLICLTAVFAMLLMLRLVTNVSYKPDLLFAVVLCVPSLLWFQYRQRNVAYAVVLALVLVVDIAQPLSLLVSLRVARSYFGVHRVGVQIEEDGSVIHKLEHGTTAHGMQFMDEARQCEPLVYYHKNGPLGEIMRAFAPREGETQHVAAVGLGAGAVACYTGPQRDVTFFEIDHVVREIAENPAYFTYLSRCAKGRYTIRMGDGRRLLEHEPAGRYQVMLLDAFSSDAIPVHLLTREALEIYMSRLTADGILAFHVSNNHLDLTPVVVDLAHAGGYVARVRDDMTIPEEELFQLHVNSTYVVVVRRTEHLRALADDPNWRPRKPSGRAIWTDEYSNVLSVLKSLAQRRAVGTSASP